MCVYCRTVPECVVLSVLYVYISCIHVCAQWLFRFHYHQHHPSSSNSDARSWKMVKWAYQHHHITIVQNDFVLPYQHHPSSSFGRVIDRAKGDGRSGVNTILIDRAKGDMRDSCCVCLWVWGVYAFNAYHSAFALHTLVDVHIHTFLCVCIITLYISIWWSYIWTMYYIIIMHGIMLLWLLFVLLFSLFCIIAWKTITTRGKEESLHHKGVHE